MAIHMSMGARVKGNPRFYTTYLDESLNKVFIAIAKQCHRRTFERRLFARYKLRMMRHEQPYPEYW